MNITRSPNDRYGWSCYYTDRWARLVERGDLAGAAQCEQLALWYFLLDFAEIQ